MASMTNVDSDICIASALPLESFKSEPSPSRCSVTTFRIPRTVRSVESHPHRKRHDARFARNSARITFFIGIVMPCKTSLPLLISLRGCKSGVQQKRLMACSRNAPKRPWINAFLLAERQNETRGTRFGRPPNCQHTYPERLRRFSRKDGAI